MAFFNANIVVDTRHLIQDSDAERNFCNQDTRFDPAKEKCSGSRTKLQDGFWSMVAPTAGKGEIDGLLKQKPVPTVARG